MEQKRRGKVIFRSGSLALKIIVAVLIVFSMAALVALRWVHTGIQARTGELRDEAAALEQQSRDLEEKIEDLGSVKSVEDIARSELGLADPNTLILDLQPQS